MSGLRAGAHSTRRFFVGNSRSVLVRWAMDDDVANLAELAGARPWLGLHELVGVKAPVEALVRLLAKFDRSESLFKLARLASVMANGSGDLVGSEAQSWTNDLLAASSGSSDPWEAAVGQAIQQLPEPRAIMHGHVALALQAAVLAFGAASEDVPSDGYLAFMMLAMNDYLHEWNSAPPKHVSADDLLLADVGLATVFNRSEDIVRFLARVANIFGRQPTAGMRKADWDAVQLLAFGCEYPEYLERFLAPLIVAASTWSDDRAPVIHRAWLGAFCEERPELLERWLKDASMQATEIGAQLLTERRPSGLPGLTQSFFRTPLVTFDDQAFLGLSPWHVRDHVTYGTWGKLASAAKAHWKTSSIQPYASHFGYQFEEWCAELAREADALPLFPDRTVLPTHPGAADEIEDVLFQHGELVAFLSAKASLVPEANLKTAAHGGEYIKWLERFFFLPEAQGKATGFKGGAIVQLDKHVRELRAGAYADRNLDSALTVLPAVICFDNVGESSLLYRWIEEQCRSRGLLQGPGIRPLTLIEAKDYELLLGVAVHGDGVCRILEEKTQPAHRLRPLDRLLYERGQKLPDTRLPSVRATYERVSLDMQKRIRP